MIIRLQAISTFLLKPFSRLALLNINPCECWASLLFSIFVVQVTYPTTWWHLIPAQHLLSNKMAYKTCIYRENNIMQFCQFQSKSNFGDHLRVGLWRTRRQRVRYSYLKITANGPFWQSTRWFNIISFDKNILIKDQAWINIIVEIHSWVFQFLLWRY